MPSWFSYQSVYSSNKCFFIETPSLNSHTHPAFSTVRFSKRSSDYVAAGSGRLTKRLADWPAFMRRWGWHHGLAFGAGMAVLPGPSAPRAEDGVTGQAGHSRGLAFSAGLHTAHRLAFKHWAPGFSGVQLYSCRRQKEDVTECLRYRSRDITF